MRRSRQVLPPPGCRPIWRKRVSNRADSPATITSHANAMFSPALTAATVGSGEPATRRNPE